MSSHARQGSRDPFAASAGNRSEKATTKAPTGHVPSRMFLDRRYLLSKQVAPFYCTVAFGMPWLAPRRLNGCADKVTRTRPLLDRLLYRLTWLFERFVPVNKSFISPIYQEVRLSLRIR